VIKLLLVDDQASVRTGLKMRIALEPDMTVVGEAANGLEAIELTPALQPDVVLMDLEMPELDGISATSRLHALSDGPAVVVLTLYDSSELRQKALDAGAAAFIGKQDVCEKLFDAVRGAVAPDSACC